MNLGDFSVRWVSPDEWLVILPIEQTFEVERALRGLIEGHFQIVNVSGGQTIFELSGPQAINVLKKSAPLDFHLSEFPVGKVANTKFAKSTAVITSYSIHYTKLYEIKQGLTGKAADAALGRANITVNKNAVPNDPQSPFVTSGLRIGSPVVTTRGFKEEECRTLAGWIADILDVLHDEEKFEATIAEVKGMVKALCAKNPVYR